MNEASALFVDPQEAFLATVRACPEAWGGGPLVRVRAGDIVRGLFAGFRPAVSTAEEGAAAWF